MLQREIKVFFLIVILMLYVDSSIVFANDSRWEKIEEAKGISLYLDTKTVENDRDKKYITYWYKLVYDNKKNGSEYTYWYRLRHFEGTPYNEIFEWAFSDSSNITPHVKYTKDSTPLFVFPDTAFEKLTNRACDIAGIKHIYDKEHHNWRWAFSTDTKTYDICTDVFVYNSSYDYLPITTIVKVHDITNGTTSFYRYLFRLTTQTYGVLQSKNMGFTEEGILPDTPQEALFNLAQELATSPAYETTREKYKWYN